MPQQVSQPSASHLPSHGSHLLRPLERRKLHKEPLLTICSSSNHIVTGGAGREIQLMSSPNSLLPSCTSQEETAVSHHQHTTLLNQPGRGSPPPVSHDLSRHRLLCSSSKRSHLPHWTLGRHSPSLCHKENETSRHLTARSLSSSASFLLVSRTVTTRVESMRQITLLPPHQMEASSRQDLKIALSLSGVCIRTN
jgi:hypothetical protein